MKERLTYFCGVTTTTVIDQLPKHNITKFGAQCVEKTSKVLRAENSSLCSSAKASCTNW